MTVSKETRFRYRCVWKPRCWVDGGADTQLPRVFGFLSSGVADGPSRSQTEIRPPRLLLPVGHYQQTPLSSHHVPVPLSLSANYERISYSGRGLEFLTTKLQPYIVHPTDSPWSIKTGSFVNVRYTPKPNRNELITTAWNIIPFPTTKPRGLDEDHFLGCWRIVPICNESQCNISYSVERSIKKKFISA